MSRTMDIAGAHETWVVPNYAPALALVKGKGARVWDAEGNEYLDFLAGIAVVSLGHAHPAWVKAIKTQAETLAMVSNLHFNELQPKLARRLASRFVEGAKVFFCNSGAEANEALIKVARSWGSCVGRHEIITMRNSFHGRTLATLTATGQDKVKKGFAPLPEGFVHADFNDIQSVRDAVTDKTVAVMVEVIQAEGGVVSADKSFLQELRALCDEKDLLLLVDDVQCGVGRLGTWFGFQSFDVTPDAFSLAKGLGGGFPIGAMVAGPKLCNVFQPGSHGTTFGGNPLACAAALAVIDTIEHDHLLDQVRSVGARFGGHLRGIAAEFDWIKAVRGTGLIWGVEIEGPVKRLEALMFAQGLIGVATAGKVMRFVPPLIVTAQDVDAAAEKFRAACRIFHEETKGATT